MTPHVRRAAQRTKSLKFSNWDPPGEKCQKNLDPKMVKIALPTGLENLEKSPKNFDF